MHEIKTQYKVIVIYTASSLYVISLALAGRSVFDLKPDSICGRADELLWVLLQGD
jgi:hypothetical protein